jgi:hypothetical protein
MKGLRIALNVRLLAALVFTAGATCVLVPGTSAAFSVGSLVGGYGCLGQALGLCDSDLDTAAPRIGAHWTLQRAVCIRCVDREESRDARSSLVPSHTE